MNFKLTKSSLNFEVYTSPTIPSSGTENDIVIISTTPMENWILSSDTPVGEPRNRGDVWIQYSVSGNVFDIMNQHDFMLAITKIYQYVDRTWTSVNARRYVGGVWDVVSSAFSATISITYPANSTCTVTNPSGQIVANDTNATSSPQTFTAIVGATGTYTVTATATDGSEKSKSQSVSITKEGQFESVTLGYQLVLFDNGAMVTPMSMGLHEWGNGGQATLEFTDVIFMSAPIYAQVSAMTDEKIDITPYKTMYVTVTKFSGGGYFDNWLLVDTKRDRTVYNYGNTPTGFAGVGAASSVGTHSLDVSSINGKYYLGIGCGSEGTVKASKVWLE